MQTRSRGRWAACALLGLASAGAASAVDDLPRPGLWSRDAVPSGWVAVESRHFQVQMQGAGEDAAALAEHLEQVLELCRRLLPTSRRIDPVAVKVFDGQAGFLAYAGPRVSASVAGLYDRVVGELLAFRTGVLSGRRDLGSAITLAPDLVVTLPRAELQRLYELFDATTAAWVLDTADVLAHEVWHRYFHAWLVSEVPLPAWLDEGLGDWFAAARPDARGRLATGALNRRRLRDLHRAVEEGATRPLGELLALAAGGEAGPSEALYAQGWSTVHFLMQHDDPLLRRLIPRLLEDFRDSKDFAESTARVLRGRDLRQLELAWRAWVLDQRADDPLAALAREFGGRVRPEDLRTADLLREAYAWHLAHPDAPARGFRER